jgi:hypothetical protein
MDASCSASAKSKITVFALPKGRQPHEFPAVKAFLRERKPAPPGNRAKNPAAGLRAWLRPARAELPQQRRAEPLLNRRLPARRGCGTQRA